MPFRLRPWRRRSFTWYLGACTCVLLVVAATIWLVPRRVHEVVSLDGRLRIPSDGSQTGRRFIWEPAQAVSPTAPARNDVSKTADDTQTASDSKTEHGEHAEPDQPANAVEAPQVPNVLRVAGAPASEQHLWSLSTPEISSAEQAVYFATKAPGQPADLYRASVLDGVWQPATPITEVNSSADDVAPVVTADGKELYFASNRLGSKGGYDIYVSTRSASGWGAPRNMGDGVNSPADETDPALTPNGLRLYFVSNRPLGEANAADAHFQLYAAQRDKAVEPWSRSAWPIDLGMVGSDVRSPVVSRDERLLYFASDRSQRERERPNFDLYRAWNVEGQYSSVENLGAVVNTPANELDPTLSQEGTLLVFASDRASEREQPVFQIYRSQTIEVEERQAWDNSRWRALASVWWQALGVTAILVLMTVVVLRSRGWLFEKASMTRFLTFSLIVHGVILWLMMLIPLGQQIAREVEEIRVTEYATKLADDNLHQSHRAGQEAYEKVADLHSLDSVALSETARQIVEQPNFAAAEEHQAPTITTDVARLLPPNRVVFAPPPRERQPAEQQTPEVARKAPDPVKAADLDPLEMELLAVEAAKEAELTEALETPRSEQTPVADAPDLPSRLDRTLPLMHADLEPEPERLTDDSPRELDAPRDVRRAPVPLASDQLPAEQEMPSLPGTPTDEGPLPLVETVVGRTDASVEPSPLKMESLAARLATARSEGLPSELDPIQAGAGAIPNAALERAERTTISPPGEKMEEVLLVGAVPTPGLDELPPKPASSAVERNADAGPAIAERGMSAPTAGAAPRPDEVARQIAAERSQPDSQTDPAKLAVDRAARPSADGASIENDPLLMPEPALSPVEAALDEPIVQDRASDALVMPALGAERAATISAPLSRADLPDAIGTRDQRAVDTPAALSPLATRLDKKPALATPVAYAEDNVGMQAMFSLRQGDVRREFIDLFGGNEQTEAAVRLGLVWLAQHQHEDGRWSLHQLDPPNKNLPASPGAGSVQSDTAATGFALLPFLGSAHTHQSGDYQPVVAAGLKWLVDHQQPDGNLFTGPASSAHMYSHGIASIALCEAYGLSEDPNLREPAQRALNYIVAAQNQGTGGWRYTPGEAGDTSVVGWQVMALKSGEMARLTVPPAALDLALRWLASAEGQGASVGTYGYTGPGGSPAMTAEGLLCRQFLGAKRDNPSLQNGGKFLLANLPQQDRDTSYYWYYATQVMYHLQGSHWAAWNEPIRDLLVRTQIKDGATAGTWDPRDPWEVSGGRIYATALRLLMLEVYYRHLPLYQPLQE